MSRCSTCSVSFSLLLIVSCNIHLSLAISCKDENNKDVDWFINYKMPKIGTEKSGSFLHSGRAYAYLSPSNPSVWKLSSNSVESPVSMLGRTWQDFANKKKVTPLSYLFYNDDGPGLMHRVAIGHLKGIVAFDAFSGIWLSHSIPRFGVSHLYEYPRSALTNGQFAFCVTYNTSVLNEICKHLLYCNPNIYEYKMAGVFRKHLDTQSRSLFSKNPVFVRKAPFKRQSILRSRGGKVIYTFAKDNQLKEDIYSGMIAPSLETSLITETWRRGAGTYLSPFCETLYSVVDVVSIDMKVSGRNTTIFFKSTEDHSKWAISIDPSSSWVCIGDLNRMASQKRRGGGALCFQSRPMWKALRSIISETLLCPV